MTCHEAGERFSEWVDEVLTPEDRALVAAHLDECSDCRRELDRLGGTIALLTRMERPRAPVGFVDRVLEAARPAPWPVRLARKIFVPLRVKLPAEAAAVLLVAGLAVYVFQRTPELEQAARGELSRPAATSTERFRDTAPPRAQRDEPAGPSQGRAATLAERPPADDQAGARRATLAQPKVEQPKAALDQLKTDSAQAESSLEAERKTGAAPGDEKKAARSERLTAAKPAPVSPEPAAPPPAPPATTEARERATGNILAPAARQAAPAPSAPALADRGRDDAAKQAPAESDRLQYAAKRRLAPSGVVGRLAVKDRETAERSLAELLARSGGTVIARREEAGTTVLDVVVPHTASQSFTEELARVGSWTPEAPPPEPLSSSAATRAEPGPLVHFTLRLVQ